MGGDKRLGEVFEKAEESFSLKGEGGGEEVSKGGERGLFGRYLGGVCVCVSFLLLFF